MDECLKLLREIVDGYFGVHKWTCASLADVPFTCDCGGEELEKRIESAVRAADSAPGCLGRQK